MLKNFKLTPKRILLISCATVLLALFSVYSYDRIDQRNLVEEGLRQQKLGNFQASIDIFKKIAVKYKGSDDAYEALFSAAEIYHFNIYNHRLAIDILEKLIKEEDIPLSVNIKSKILLADIYSEQSDEYDAALKLLKEAGREEITREERKRIFLISAEICLKKRDYEKAVEYFNSALRKTSDAKERLDLLIKLASSYTVIFEREKEEEVLRQVLDTPELEDERRMRIEMLLFQNLDEQDKLDDALALINSMIEKDPQNPLLRRERKRVQEALQFEHKTKNKLWWQ
jgi:tetratricopeptide (TPR) repeat protein